MKSIFRLLPAFLILALLATEASAQRKRLQYNQTYDDHLLHMGFTLGVNSIDYRLSRSGFLFDSQCDTVVGIQSESYPGFTIGIIADLRLGKFFSLRLLPAMQFGGRDLIYRVRDWDNKNELSYIDQRMQYSVIYLSAPVLLKIKAKRINNFRPFLVVGGSYRYDLDTRREDNKNKGYAVKFYPEDIMFEFGGGVDFYLPYFKLGTEIKFCYGTNDIIRHDATEFTRSLDAVQSKMTEFSLHFE